MSKKKTNNQFLQELSIKNPNLIALEEYKTNNSKIKLKCKICNNEFEAKPVHLLSKNNPTGCPKCSKKRMALKQSFSKEQWCDRIKEISNNEYEIYEFPINFKNVQDKVKFIHKIDNHIFEMTLGNFIYGNQRCPLHRYDNCKLFESKNHEYFINRIKNECFDYNEYTFLEQFKGSNVKVKVRHNCGHEYEVSPNKFLNNRRCPICSKPQNSKGMKKIKKYLEDNNIQYEIEKKFNDCKNPEGTRYLYFDIWIKSLNLLIEFDGEYHDQINGRNNKNKLERRILLDNIKNDYCKNNKIYLLRIHYSKINEIDKILDKYLNSTTIANIFNESYLITEKE